MAGDLEALNLACFFFFCVCALFFVPALFCTANIGEKAHCPGPAEHGGFFFPLQAGEKNELFSSKHAYSWPIVSFDLGMGRLHEWALLSCYVYTVCELLKVARAPASSGRDYSAGMLGWRAGAADLPDAVYLFLGHMTVGTALTKK